MKPDPLHEAQRCRLMDPKWRYVGKENTDVRATFERFGLKPKDSQKVTPINSARKP